MANFAWINGTKAEGDRTIIIELYVGRGHYRISDPETVAVRGVPGRFGYVEDGYGLEWYKGEGACGLMHLELFGNTTKRELVRFANGLIRRDL